MSEPGRVLVIVLLSVGCAVTVVSCCAMFALRSVYDRLHLLAPVTSLGAPLIGAALVIQNGWGFTSGEIFLIIVLLVFTGPAVGVATARAAAERDHTTTAEEPE